MHTWSPSSWRSKPATQQPTYRSKSDVETAVARLALLPPLVTPWEIASLKKQIAEAAEGRRFILQGGDCAERFADCEADAITNKLKILLQMSLVLIHGGRKPVTRIGRFAGQYAKPRSEDTETRDGVTLAAYRGDLVNRPEFTAADREPDPRLMVRGYECAALTLNFLRALVRGGFADLHHPEYWDLDFVNHSPLGAEYRRMVESIGESLQFMESVLGVRAGEMEWVEFFTSHEGLLLHYEEAQTRLEANRKTWFNQSTHFPWIGARTLDPDGAHVEYFRGIGNPIGLKVPANLAPERLLRLLDALDPGHEAGRMTLIHRMGREKLPAALPPLIRAVQGAGRKVAWICDPMHGNTRVTSEKFKTRDFRDILGELETAFDAHASEKSVLAGVHIELTGENVTECTGGARGLTEVDLKRAYKSEVDPRLNGEQALEIAMLIARKLMSQGVQ